MCQCYISSHCKILTQYRKHMKRHQRPYGCTFPRCGKTFGSKNDWKRHENSQHYHLETWRCSEISSESEGSATCTKVYYRKQTFTEHLSKTHGITADDKQKDKLESCRLGRNCQSQFWCGFCENLVSLTKSGLDAWTERFDHIDDHFMGKQGFPAQTIENWTSVDSDKATQSLDTDSLPSTTQSRTEAASSKRNRSLGDVGEGTKRTRLAAKDMVIFCVSLPTVCGNATLTTAVSMQDAAQFTIQSKLHLMRRFSQVLRTLRTQARRVLMLLFQEGI